MFNFVSKVRTTLGLLAFSFDFTLGLLKSKVLSVTQEKSFELGSAGRHCGGKHGPCQKHKAENKKNN
jgi:hypothetical protein